MQKKATELKALLLRPRFSMESSSYIYLPVPVPGKRICNFHPENQSMVYQQLAWRLVSWFTGFSRSEDSLSLQIELSFGTVEKQSFSLHFYASFQISTPQQVESDSCDKQFRILVAQTSEAMFRTTVTSQNTFCPPSTQTLMTEDKVLTRYHTLQSHTYF